MSIKFFDMFSGIGGFRSGLEALDGFECIGYCEIDKYAKKAYEAIYDTEGELYFEDARTIDPKDLPDIDLIVGGFPCQSFSICGKRGGFEDARGTLFFEIARIAEVKRPKYLLLENVPGLLNHDSGRTFATILSTLDELGYDVTWQVLNSKDYGVPQARRRVYIVGYNREKCTLTDNNGVLSKFAYKTSGNIAVSISGNKMTLATNSPITEPKTLAINKTVPTVSGNSVLVAFGDSSKQDVITGLAAPDPVPSVFKLQTSAGHLKIVKTAEDGNISGIEFTVTGTNFNKTAKTDAKGELVLAGLVPGSYTVTETPSDKYVKQPAQTVTVENGKTATVSFNNKLDRGDLKIIKTSEDNIVADIQFTITGTNYNQTAKTDKDGTISLTNLLPGTYTVTEAPSDKYEKQDPQTVKVEYGKTATVKFHNKIDRGGLDIIKTSEDGIVENIEFTVTGDNFNQTVKTDKNGKINIPNLLPGKYTVTEKTPERYVNQQSQTVTVENGKTATVTFKNILKRSEIVIQKKDMESKKIIPLAGFGFRIKKADGTFVKDDGKDTFYTDKTGTIKLPIQLTYGKYQLIEVKAGTGYVLDGKPIDFTVDGTKTVVTIEKYNKAEKGRILAEFAERNNIPEVERESFFFRSGLQTIREFDHPLPAIRIDAIVRIVDECIDAFAPEGEADYWSEQVSDYSWEVEIVRNNYNLGNLYRHIAYTPTAQDFIQEMQALWEKNRDIFPAIVKPLVRLFYVNRLVHMTDDGVLI